MTKEPSSTTNLVPFKYFFLSISHFSLFIPGPHPPLPTDWYHCALVHKLPKLGLYEMTVLPLTKNQHSNSTNQSPPSLTPPAKPSCPLKRSRYFQSSAPFPLYRVVRLTRNHGTTPTSV